MASVQGALAHLGIVAWRQNPIAAPWVRGGQVVWRNNASGQTGLSDIGGVCPGGRFIAVEVKSRAGRLRPKQALYLDSVTRIGGLALVVRSLDDLWRALGRAPRVTWYGVPSPFLLTQEQRQQHEQAAFREKAERMARRRMAKAG